MRMWFDKTLSRKLDLHLSADGAVRNRDYSLFQNERLVPSSALPTNFDDLTAAMQRGDFTNSQLASILTGMPVVGSPAQTIIFGSRSASSGASLYMTYAYTRRLHFFWGAGAGVQQSLPRRGEDPGFLNHSVHGNADVGFTYSLGNRTQLSGTAGAGRTHSVLSDR